MDWLSGILDFLGGLGSLITEIIQVLINVIIAVAQFIWNALQFIASIFVTVFKNIGAFFQHLWNGFFKGIFQSIIKAIVKAHDFLEAHLRPIINFLKRVQQIVQRFYRTYVRPFLQMLDHVRKVLSIFRALGFKWAAALDSKISEIEGKVRGAFLAVNAVLNSAIDLLNLIADPTKLLRRPTLLLSFRRVFSALIRSLTGLPPAFFFPSPRKGAPLGLGFLPANFNPADPAQNPPASYYLGLDGGVPSLDALDPDTPVPDSLVDGADMLDAFDNSLFPSTGCADTAQCLQQAEQGLVASIYGG